MQLTRRDDFVRADNDLLGTATPGPGVWTEQIYGTAGDVDIISNAVGATLANSSAWLSGTVGPVDAVGMTLKTLAAGAAYIAIYFHIVNPGVAGADAYELSINGSTDWSIFRMIDSGFSQVGISNPFQQRTITAGDGVGIKWTVLSDRVRFTFLHRVGGHGNEFVEWGTSPEDTDAARLTAPGSIGIELGDTTGRIDDMYQGIIPTGAGGFQ